MLFGRVNPSGCLPFSCSGECGPTCRFFDRDAAAIDYDLWHGYTKLERDGVDAAYPFGFGLSYTRFEYADVAARLDTEHEVLQIGVDVTNSGDRPGDTVVQVYAGWDRQSVDQPRKRLCGFERVSLEAGATRRVAVEVALRDLAWFDASEKRWRLGESAWRVSVGPNSSAADALAVVVELTERTWSIRER